MKIENETLKELKAYPICYRIKRLRCIAGYTQDKLAHLIGYTQTSVAKWENNVAIPSGIALQKIMNLFELPNDFFVDAELESIKFFTKEKKQQ